MDNSNSLYAKLNDKAGLINIKSYVPVKRVLGSKKMTLQPMTIAEQIKNITLSTKKV